MPCRLWGPLSNLEKASLASQLCTALAKVHRSGIAHMDLKVGLLCLVKLKLKLPEEVVSCSSRRLQQAASAFLSVRLRSPWQAW